MQKRAPDKCAVLRGAEFSVEFVAWCLIWRGAALAVAAQPLPPPRIFGRQGPPADLGGVAQLGERLLCKQEVIGSIPFTSTTDATHIVRCCRPRQRRSLRRERGAGGKSWCSFLHGAAIAVAKATASAARRSKRCAVRSGEAVFALSFRARGKVFDL